MRRLALVLCALILGASLAYAQSVVFTDYRGEKPGVVHRITVADLPKPDFEAGKVANASFPSPRPANAWPQVPAGFKVEVYADHLNMARELRLAPNGDIFISEPSGRDVRVFRGVDGNGRARETRVFARDLNLVYGMAFYPLGANPQWLYVSTPTAVYRFPYRTGDMGARGGRETLIKLPADGHWTRDLCFSKDGRKLFVAVGSRSNVSDDPSETDRACVLEFNPDGSGKRVYVSGVRNSGAGLAVHPESGELWGSVNERDGMGDNLPPDYVTHFEEGGFYGWPWFYIGNHPDPRHPGKHPELAPKVIVPDVLLQPHDAPLQLAFYQGQNFPKRYHGDLFCASHGSWNRSVFTGYELIRIPMRGKTRATGEYEDFMTGFVTPDGKVWGRPVGVATAQDGALLVSDDMSNTIWRVTWSGK